MRSADQSTPARIRDAAITLFAERGFDVGVRPIAAAAGVSAGLVLHHFGSKDGLRQACDDYVAEQIRQDKVAALRAPDPASWLAQLNATESYAPLTAYLMRSLHTGTDLAKSLWRRMIDNAEDYLAEGVRAGTIKPSADPRARARYLAMIGGGGLLLYLQLHDTPDDFEAVLRDYVRDMVPPALELYTQGLLTDASLYEAMVTDRTGTRPAADHPDAGNPTTADDGGGPDDR
ncbi:TetR family transcriptional regulator [Mycolicibacillus trivialis]|uniref:TetR family transcriptional regulator n=1 Tax=Mycolicibacillus trivialis TaxID=1798 RepID=A0A1X2EP96_9MYCO|nr:TetR family transcriptional regulator [Mycolicibacillus trivialis]ORX07517.1 TetR family transcriptional regulator [Mycolicibacillus trivialis]